MKKGGIMFSVLLVKLNVVVKILTMVVVVYNPLN